MQHSSMESKVGSDYRSYSSNSQLRKGNDQFQSNYLSKPIQDFNSQPRQNYNSQSNQDCNSQPRQNFNSQSNQDYNSQARQECFFERRQDYSSKDKQDFVSKPGHNYFQSRQDFSFRPRYDSRENYNSQSRQDYNAQYKKDYFSRTRDDYNPKSVEVFEHRPAQDFNSQPSNDDIRRPKGDSNFQSNQVSYSQTRAEFASQIGEDDENGKDNRFNEPNCERRNPFERRRNEAQEFNEPIRTDNYFKDSYGSQDNKPNDSSLIASQLNPSGSKNLLNADTSIPDSSKAANKGRTGRIVKGLNKTELLRLQNMPNELLKYCYLCNVVCEGQQAYEAHLKENQHKSKEHQKMEREEQAEKNPLRAGDLMCPLCHIYCSNTFAYRTHIKGKKHKQVVRIHKVLNKPVPKCNISTAKFDAFSRALPVGEEYIENVKGKLLCKLCNSRLNTDSIHNHCKQSLHRRQYARMMKNAKTSESDISNYEGNEKDNDEKPEKDTSSFNVDDFSFWEVKLDENRMGNAQIIQASVVEKAIEEGSTQTQTKQPLSCNVCNLSFPDEFAYSTHLRGGRHRKELKYQNRFLGIKVSKKDVKASKAEAYAKIPLVGEDYLELVNNSRNLAHCKLCNCSFGNNSRDCHLKGKKHRLAYKEKVDPNFVVQDCHEGGVSWNTFVRMKRKEERKKFSEDTINESNNQLPKNEAQTEITSDVDSDINVKHFSYADQQIIEKNSSIYPKDSELQYFVKSLSDCESALQNVSEKNSADATEKDNLTVKAIVKVGTAAKDLMLSEEYTLSIVVLCQEILNKSSLNNFFTIFTEEMEHISQSKMYTSTLLVKDATIVVTTSTNPNITIIIVLTSISLAKEIHCQEELLVIDEINYYDKPVHALTQLRRIRWFKAKLENHENGIIIVRILRALSREHLEWKPLTCWILELLVHNVIEKGEDLSLADILRNVVKSIAGGILLSDSCGVTDPCEKESIDAADYLSVQQKTDITSSAQNFLEVMDNSIDLLFHPIEENIKERISDDKRKSEDSKEINERAKKLKTT